MLTNKVGVPVITVIVQFIAGQNLYTECDIRPWIAFYTNVPAEKATPASFTNFTKLAGKRE